MGCWWPCTGAAAPEAPVRLSPISSRHTLCASPAQAARETKRGLPPAVLSAQEVGMTLLQTEARAGRGLPGPVQARRASWKTQHLQITLPAKRPQLPGTLTHLPVVSAGAMGGRAPSIHLQPQPRSSTRGGKDMLAASVHSTWEPECMPHAPGLSTAGQQASCPPYWTRRVSSAFPEDTVHC